MAALYIYLYLLGGNFSFFSDTDSSSLIKLTLEKDGVAIFEIDDRSIDSINFERRVFYLAPEVRAELFSLICDNRKSIASHTLNLKLSINKKETFYRVDFADPWISLEKYLKKDEIDYSLSDQENFLLIPDRPTIFYSCGSMALGQTLQLKFLYKHKKFDSFFSREVCNRLKTKFKLTDN